MTGYYIDEIHEGKFRFNRILKEYDTREEAEKDLFRILGHEIDDVELEC